MRKVVGFLQNSWSPFYAGDTWPRDSWLRALHRSRSGQRLAVLTKECADLEFWWDNTTAICGSTSDSVVPPDDDHIRGILETQNPDIVVTFGKQAAKAVMPLTDMPLLLLPHPAYRVVTNELFIKAGVVLVEGFKGVAEVVQLRGKVIYGPYTNPRGSETAKGT